MRGQGLLIKVALALVFSAAGASSLAQSGGQSVPQTPGAGAQSDADARRLVGDLQEIQRRLITAQEQALEESPQLQEQARDYQGTLLAAMREEGFEPQRELSHIELLQQQLQADDLNDQERVGLVAELQEAEERLSMAEQQALQQQNVQEAREEFMQALLVAMREQEPETDRLIQELDEKGAELRSMMTAEAETE